MVRTGLPFHGEDVRAKLAQQVQAFARKRATLVAPASACQGAAQLPPAAQELAWESGADISFGPLESGLLADARGLLGRDSLKSPMGTLSPGRKGLMLQREAVSLT